MSGISISKQVRDQVRTFLSASDGFNATLTALASDYGITPFVIDFTGNPSNNFFQSQVDARQLEESSTIKYPIMTLFSNRIEDDNEQKFQRFSGKVLIGLDLFLSWKTSHALPDSESLGDAIEATVVDVMNRQSNQGWNLETVYNGNVSLTRLPLRLAASSWRQTLRFLLHFEVEET